jgi:hypothetical protein
MDAETLERRYCVFFRKFKITTPLSAGAQSYIIRFEDCKPFTPWMVKGYTASGLTAREAEAKVAATALQMCQYEEV